MSSRYFSKRPHGRLTVPVHTGDDPALQAKVEAIEQEEKTRMFRRASIVIQAAMRRRLAKKRVSVVGEMAGASGEIHLARLTGETQQEHEQRRGRHAWTRSRTLHRGSLEHIFKDLDISTRGYIDLRTFMVGLRRHERMRKYLGVDPERNGRDIFAGIDKEVGHHVSVDEFVDLYVIVL